MSRKYQILAIDQTNNWIEVAGDYTGVFKKFDAATKVPATVFNIKNSNTDNDKVTIYEVKSDSTYNATTKRTKIFTSGLRSNTAAGVIHNSSNYSIESNWGNDRKAKIVVDESEEDVTNSALTFFGRNSYPWGELLWQNMFSIVENFASTTAPTYPTEGQFWYHPVEKRLRICTAITRDANATPIQVGQLGYAAPEWRIIPILGSNTYKHVQSVAASAWVIDHNMNTDDINFTIYIDIGGGILKPIFPSDVTINSLNRITLDFSAARKGKALITMVM